MNKQELRERFGVIDGHFFSYWFYKNLRLHFGDEEFCFTDLRLEDIERIQAELKPGETITGWNEHHGTRFQQGNTPMVVITHDRVKNRAELRQEYIDGMRKS